MTLAMNEYRHLVYRTRRRATRDDALTLDEKIAINVYWRDGVRVPIIARVFKVSKNTVYYSALTGNAGSYPQNAANTAAEVNDIIEELGVEKARERYVTDRMQGALEAELQREAARREALEARAEERRLARAERRREKAKRRKARRIHKQA